jgi:hypothetical protein
MLPKPRKGSYFPISPRRAASLTKAWRLYYSAYFERTEEAPISFANPSGKATDLPLVELERQHSVTIYSVPDAIAPEMSSRAVERALEACGELSRGWTSVKGQAQRTYLIRFEDPATLILFERTVHYQRRKYRGAQKFSHAFKSRRSRAAYKELRRISLE